MDSIPCHELQEDNDILINADRNLVSREEALRMCSLYPAEFLGLSERHGQLRPGSRADMVWIDEVPTLKGVWIGGNPVDLQQMSGK